MDRRDPITDIVLHELGLAQDERGRLWARCQACGGHFHVTGLRVALDCGRCPSCADLDLLSVRELARRQGGGKVVHG